jgi:hypothetical protein
VMMVEPYSISDASRSAGDLFSSVVIFWTGIEGSSSCSVIEKGQVSVAVRCGELTMAAVCVSPYTSRTKYVSFLEGLVASARHLGVCSSLTYGNFNAHSNAWSSLRTDGMIAPYITGRRRSTSGLLTGRRPVRAWRRGASP